MCLHLTNDKSCNNNKINSNKTSNSRTNNNKINSNSNNSSNKFKTQQHLHLNWSNFKPEFTGKPDEDAEVHFLCSNYWMNVHQFVDGVKVQRFCLTLLGEARLWYHSLEPINVDWAKL